MVDDRNPSDLTSTFDTSRDQAAHDRLRQSEFDLRQTEIDISAGKLTPENTAKVVNQTRIGKGVETEEKRKERQRHDHHVMLVVLEQLQKQLRELEAELIDKYGENFAENLAAEMLDEDIYAEIMLIQNQDERRRQIALEINRGLANGTIDPTLVENNQDYVNWLNKHDNIEQQLLNMSDAELDNDQKSIRKDMAQDIEVAENSNLESGFNSLFSGKTPTGI